MSDQKSVPCKEEQKIIKEIKSCERRIKSAKIFAIILFVLAIPSIAVPIFSIFFIAFGIIIWMCQIPNKKVIEKLTAMQNEGIFLVEDVKHIAGLPIGEYTPCKLMVGNECCKIRVGTQDYKLLYSKVVAAESATQEQISYVSQGSALGGIAGGVLLGVAGAVIGSRPQAKRMVDRTNYLIINYQSDDGVKAMVFEIPYAKKVVSVIKERMPQQSKEIEI